MRTVSLSNEWLTWIQLNLARGCTAQSMVDAMVRDRIDPEVAALAVRQVAATTAGGIAESTRAEETALDARAFAAPNFPQTGKAIRTRDRDVSVRLRIAKPVIAVLDDLLSAAECAELIGLSAVKIKRSTVVDPVTGEHKVIDDRGSFGTFFSINENDLIARLDRRIAEVMCWPVENGEGLQILNYKVGGEYKPHFDYFPPDDAGSRQHLANGGQRVSTMVIYLNDVEEGGETSFPSLNLSILPRKGSAVYFEYCDSRGQVDPLTLHAGAPVVAGEKWIATKWMRQGRYGNPSSPVNSRR